MLFTFLVNQYTIQIQTLEQPRAFLFFNNLFLIFINN